MEQALELILGELRSVSGKIDQLDNKVDQLEQEVRVLKKNVSDIQLTLENETNKNIRIIAEGHLNLSRNLDDVLRVENEKEMLMIRVNVLENEMRRTKERIDAIA